MTKKELIKELEGFDDEDTMCAVFTIKGVDFYEDILEVWERRRDECIMMIGQEK